MAIKVTYGAKANPDAIISLDLAKKNSRIDYEFEDELLVIFLGSAFEQIENYTSDILILREDSIIESDDFEEVITPGVRIDQISKIEYTNINDIVTEMNPSGFKFSESSVRITKPNDFKSKLKITCDLGYSANSMPADIKRAVLLIFSAADTYREDMPVRVNTSAQTLLRPYRKY